MMKFTFWIVWVMLSLTPGLVMAQNSKTVYTCPMHPEVQQAGPGKCPKCGMALVKKNIKAKTPTPKSGSETSAQTRTKASAQTNRQAEALPVARSACRTQDACANTTTVDKKR